MTYFDGFVIAVENARKQELIDHAMKDERMRPDPADFTQVVDLA